MEDSQAAFLQMIMDRLHALEAACDSLPALENTCDLLMKDNARVRKDVAQLQKSLHLNRDLTKFSDGILFSPGFTKEIDQMWSDCDHGTHDNPDDLGLDELHLQATACYGGTQIHPHEECWDDTIEVGEAGIHDQRINVRQLVDAINAWCLSPCQNGKSKVDQYMLCSSLGGDEPYGPDWEGLKLLHFDHDTQRSAYELLISF